MADYDISAAFAVIEDYLIDSMRRNMLRHIGEEQKLGINWSQWQAEMLKGLAEYKQDNEELFNSLYSEINKKIDAMMWQSYSTGESEQEAEILAAVRQGYKKFHPVHDLNGEFFKLNRDKLNSLISETQQSMQKAEYAALRMANDQYRKIIFGAQTFYNSGAGTLWQAVDMASKSFLNAGLNCIEYKNGARVNIASYAEMALRTANTRAYLHGEAARREQYGIHTVIVNRHNAACPLCIQWQGRVFIDDVWGGGTKAEAENAGYPLLSEAIAGGLYHPNCKDSHTTYFEGVSRKPNPPTAKQKSEQARRYNLQQEQRYNERNIRRYKRLYEGTMDEAERTKYLSRLRKWQERNRSLIEENPKILRQAPEREKTRDSLKKLGVTPPQNPPGIELKIKQPEPKNAPNAPQIIIEGHFVDPAKKVKVQPAGTAEAERQKAIETIQAKARLVTAKAKELQKEAQIAQYKASVAETKAKIAARNANTARGQVNMIKARIQLIDKNVAQQRMQAKLAIADAKKLRSIAEIRKIEMRAARRRYSAIMKMQNGGHLNVAVSTRTVKKIPVTVKPQPTVKKIAATAVKPVVKTREQLAAEISKQSWLRQAPKECRSDINKMFSGMDDKRLRFFEKYGNLIKGNLNHVGTGYHNRTGIHVELKVDPNNRDFQRSIAAGYKNANVVTLMHETGHLMDSGLRIGENLPQLTSLLAEDYRNYVMRLVGVDIRQNSLTQNQIKKIASDVSGNDEDKIFHNQSSVSDIIEGITNGKLTCSYGHVSSHPTYWNDGTKLPMEAVAHMFEAYMVGGERYEAMIKYFPKAMEYFENYINKL